MAQNIANVPINNVMRGGSAVAEISTGPKQQERERIFQAAGEIEQRREFGDVEAEQPCGAVRLEPLRLMKAHAQRHIEQRRERDDGEARPDRHLEFEAEMHHQNGRELADHGKPAQPDQSIQPHVSRTLISPWQTEHAMQTSYAINVTAGAAIAKGPLPLRAPPEWTGACRALRENGANNAGLGQCRPRE